MDAERAITVPEVDLFGQVIESLPQEHEWTLELVRARRPEVYRAVVGMLSCAVPVRHIAEQLGVSHHTVTLIRDVDAAMVATQTRAYAERLRCQSAQAFAHAMCKLPEASSRDAAVTAGILLDHAQLLMGQPTEITETKRVVVERPADPAAAWDRVIEVSAKVQTSDSESGVNPSLPVEQEPLSPAAPRKDTELDTPHALHTPTAGQVAGQVEEAGGGGCALARGHGEAMASVSEKENFPLGGA
jgi:hypothetical protein